MATLRTLERNLDFDNQVMITIIIIIVIIIIAFEPINEAVDLPTILGNNLWLTFFFFRSQLILDYLDHVTVEYLRGK